MALWKRSAGGGSGELRTTPQMLSGRYRVISSASQLPLRCGDELDPYCTGWLMNKIEIGLACHD